MNTVSGRLPLALVADDDLIIRMFAREALEQAGWTVVEAQHGREACAVFEQCTPDVVLLDVMMPEMDGFATCAALRQQPTGEHTPILIMTGLVVMSQSQIPMCELCTVIAKRSSLVRKACSARFRSVMSTTNAVKV